MRPPAGPPSIWEVAQCVCVATCSLASCKPPRALPRTCNAQMHYPPDVGQLVPRERKLPHLCALSEEPLGVHAAKFTDDPRSRIPEDASVSAQPTRLRFAKARSIAMRTTSAQHQYGTSPVPVLRNGRAAPEQYRYQYYLRAALVLYQHTLRCPICLPDRGRAHTWHPGPQFTQNSTKIGPESAKFGIDQRWPRSGHLWADFDEVWPEFAPPTRQAPAPHPQCNGVIEHGKGMRRVFLQYWLASARTVN